MNTTMPCRLWTVTALFALTLPSGAWAQQATRAPLATDQTSEKADRLDRQAVELAGGGMHTQPFQVRLRKAAQLSIRAAQLRSPTDARAESSMLFAAQSLYSLDPERATEIMAEAADHALARGDVHAAAHRYLDVAWITTYQKHHTRAEIDRGRNYASKAELLASSPLLTDAQRGSILARIAGNRSPLRTATAPRVRP